MSPPTPLLAVRRRPDGAVSEVVGSILMVGLTVAVAAGLFTVVYGAIPSEEGALRATLSGSIDRGAGDWGSGDETVTVAHGGGQALPASHLAIAVGVSGNETRYVEGGANPLVHAGQEAFSATDRNLTIGETWTSSDLEIGPATRVAVTVTDTSAGQVIWSGTFVSGSSACGTDTQPPTVSSWSQSPSDVTTSTTGDVTVTATVADNCGVDTTTDPHLHYRLNDGSNPAFTDAGAMTLQSGTTWEGTIPDQNWSNHGGETLEYKLVDMTDESGNTGDSSVQQDLVDDCPNDTDPPTVSSWSQTPSNVTTSTSGDVTVEATLSDNCAGVDTTSDPHLHYRINAGSDPAFNDTGAMTLVSGTTWEGAIPDPNWSSHGGKTLEYKLVDMVDEKGNTGESTVQQDPIEQGSAESYVQTPLPMVTGTSSNDDAARSADDAGAAATLTEASTGTQETTTNYYGTASQGTAGTNPSNAEGSPDDTYATLDASNEFVEASGFSSGTETISKVEIALEGQHDGGRDAGKSDVIELSHNQGSTTDTYALTTSDTRNFLDVTGDTSWTWTKIENLAVTATCLCHDHQNDLRVFSIDTLWVRVTTSSDVYELETDAWTFDPLNGNSPFTLEIRYKTSGSETYEVQIWDGSSWTVQSPQLDQTSYTVFSEQLTSAEVSAGPQIRVLDTGAAQNTQSSVDLDYVRVVGS